MTASVCPGVARADGGPVPCAHPGRPVVTLLSGATCCSWCEAWRAETADREREARRILKMPEKASRLFALADHEAAHGPESRNRLEAAILALWALRRATKGAA